MNRSIFVTSVLALCIAAPLAAGCAANTDSEYAEEQVAETQDELTAAASQVVGSYWTHTPTFGGFGRLNLKANGKYEAQVDAAGRALCITSPCLLPERGSWNAFAKAGGGYRVRIRATGAASRWYDATKTGGVLELTRSGETQTLNALGANACLDDADCGAGEECGPKFCLMWCPVGDATCCGPSTCRPKTTPPPPPPACFGAWLDQFGACRTPADGVYPDSCCAGLTSPCGSSACGVGEVCCNPLLGICTKPGEFCAM